MYEYVRRGPVLVVGSSPSGNLKPNTVHALQLVCTNRGRAIEYSTVYPYRYRRVLVVDLTKHMACAARSNHALQNPVAVQW